MEHKLLIEEYVNADGQSSARLQEKHTEHKVNLGFADVADRQSLLQF